MRSTPRVRGAVVVAVLAVLGGCGGAPAPPPPPVPAPSTAPSTAPGPARSPDDAACAAHPDTVETVRGIAAAAATMPVLPAGVALFLLDARRRAAGPGLADPALAAAQAELVAAIDDLDAQGSAALPPGGNPAQNPVRVDTARLVAAVETVERACAARPDAG